MKNKTKTTKMADYGIDINVNMGSAGGNFQTLIDSINNLNATFQKIGTAGDDAAKKHKQSFSDSMAIMAKYGNSVKQVETEISKLKKQIIESNSSLEKRTINDKQHKEAVDKLSTSLKQLQTAQRQYNTLLGQTASHTKSATLGLNTLTTTFNKLGAALGVSFGLYGVFRVLTSIVKTIAEFDLAQKKLQSILGETTNGMKELSQSAIDLGKNSIFGAKGVSELQIELAKMGFTKNEIMAMQTAINNLAIATQEDLASSAETVANIIKVYGMSANETTRIVDIMGKAFNDSALGLSNFREGIKYIAPVAVQAGLSFEQTVAGMELLANAGLKGSLTGTAFNNVLKAMMDSNSKLAKQMGGAVQGWDGFVSVLQRARDEGWNMQDIFGLITQRATGAFAILKDGIPTLLEMEKGLRDVSGIIAQQALVQMQSLTYSAKQLQEQWKALILEIDSGNSVFSQGMKTVLDFGSALIWSLTNSANDVEKEFNKTLKDLDAAQEYYVDKNDTRATQSINKQVEMLEKMKKAYMSIGATGVTAYPFAQFALKQIEATNQVYIDSLVEASNAEIKRFGITSGLQEQWARQKQRGLELLSLELTQLERNGKKEEFEYKVKVEAMQKIEKMTFERISDIDTEEEKRKKAHDAYMKRLRERYQFELDMLKINKDIEDEQIKDRLDSYEELFNLQINAYTYNVEKAKKELELAIKQGENEVQAKTKYNALLEFYALEHSNKMVDIREKMNEELNKAEEKLLKDAMKFRDENSKDFVKDWEKRMKDLDEFMKKFKFDNPILGMILGQKIEEDIFSGIMSEEDAENLADAFNKAFDTVGDRLMDSVDAWVSATDEIVNQLNRQVDETQAALDTEAELMAAGYANNVTLKRKELEELKKQRKEALEDQKKAQMAQLNMESALQISGLITSAVNVFQAESNKGLLGVALAITGVATIFAMMAKYRALAKEQSMMKFEEGGWIGGKRHSQGGTVIEAEHGEYVINRNSASKYRNLIEAVNNDNKLELNKIYLNGVKGQVLKTNVSIDDSKYLKGIYERLDKDKKTVEYSNGYRIEKIGNVTTRIKLSLN